MSDTIENMSAAAVKGIELRPRDFEVLRGLFESRVMKLQHATDLYFNGKNPMAKKRLQKLKAAGFVRERPRSISGPSVLFLGAKGFRALQNEGKLTAYPRIGLKNLEKRAQVGDLTLRHELEVMTVKAALVCAIKRTEAFEVAEFSTWPLLYGFKACRPDGRYKDVWPDGFIRIHEKEPEGMSEHCFFLEVDRSTEAPAILLEQIHCYGDHYRSGGFALSKGYTREQFNDVPFRVLYVCKSAKRRDNVALQVLQNSSRGLTQVWLTTLAEVVSDPLGSIWVRPADYRRVRHEENENALVKRGLFDEG